MRLSLYGLLQIRPDVLDLLHLPSDLDRKTVNDLIILKSWDLELVYPFPDFMKSMIETWSAAHLWSWQKLTDTTKFEYNPIWNKDGTVTETEARKTKGNTSATSKEDATSESVAQTNAFNGGAFQDREKATGKDGSTRTDAGSSSGSEDITRTRRETGNIGLMSTQSMIREEREVSDFSIYETIAEQFVETFCLTIF